MLCFACILQSSSTCVNGATGARFLRFQNSVLSTDENVEYDRIINEVGKYDEGKGTHVDKTKCVLMFFMMLHIVYAHTVFVNKISPFEVKRTLDSLDSCRSRND